jgi:hypothetical protein
MRFSSGNTSKEKENVMNKYCLIALPILLLAACGDSASVSVPTGDGKTVGMDIEMGIAPKKIEALGVPVPPRGTVLGASNMEGAGMGISSIVIQNAQPPAEIEAWYKKTLPTKGYTLGPVIDAEGSNMFDAKSSKAELTLKFIGQEGGAKTETLIMLGRRSSAFNAKPKGRDNG